MLRQLASIFYFLISSAFIKRGVEKSNLGSGWKINPLGTVPSRDTKALMKKFARFAVIWSLPVWLTVMDKLTMYHQFVK